MTTAKKTFSTCATEPANMERELHFHPSLNYDLRDGRLVITMPVKVTEPMPQPFNAEMKDFIRGNGLNLTAMEHIIFSEIDKIAEKIVTTYAQIGKH